MIIESEVNFQYLIQIITDFQQFIKNIYILLLIGFN